MPDLDRQALDRFWDEIWAICLEAQAEADANPGADLKRIAAEGRLANIPAATPAKH